MDTVDIAVSAAVGAVVALGATFVMKTVTDAQTQIDRKNEEEKAYAMGRQHGWTEGQDSYARQFADKVTTPEFTQR